MQKLILPVAITMVLAACSHSETRPDYSSTHHEEAKAETELIKRTTPKQASIENYEVKYGYLKYNEEKFGFDNPGFMTIYKNGNAIYKDSFEGEGEVEVESLGYQDLDGKKLVLRLNYGTEACDYRYTSKYYIISNNDVSFLKECYSVTGGDHYSSKFYEHFLPNDSNGHSNSILIVEGQIFHEHDQPDRFDTTYIKFADNRFVITKPTDNLSKVK